MFLLYAKFINILILEIGLFGGLVAISLFGSVNLIHMRHRNTLYNKRIFWSSFPYIKCYFFTCYNCLNPDLVLKEDFSPAYNSYYA